MYVCICNSIKERDIRTQARRGLHDTAEDLIDSLNGCVKCGLCQDHIDCIIEEETCVTCAKQQEYGVLANNNSSQHTAFVKVAAE